MKSVTRKRQKAKIGIVLDKEIIRKLKERALKEGKPLNALIEEAIERYDQLDALDRTVRLKALDSFLSIRFNISDRDWKAIMEEDVFGNEP
jgi:hypothetical protein